MRNALLLSLLLIGSALTYAQTPGVEALRQALDGTPDGPARLDLLLRLSDTLRRSTPKEALDYAQAAGKLARTLQQPPQLAEAHLLEGEAHLQMGNHRRALRALEDALPLIRAQRDTAQLLRVLLRLDDVHRARGDLDVAKPIEEEYLLIRQMRLQNQMAAIDEGIAQGEALAESARSAESEALEALLAETEEDLRQKALALARIKKEAADLDRDRARLEQENLRRQLQLEQEQRKRNWLIAGLGFLVVLGLGGWQRLNYLRQREAAQLEKQRAERLQEIDQLKDQFLANTSHELRTPLNGIIGLAEALYDSLDGGDPDTQRTNLSMIISAGRQLSHLVNDLLDFSRLKNNALDLQLRPVDLKALADVVLRINTPQAQKKGLILLNEVPDGLPAVMADEDRLQQILHNLIGNAIKFTERGEVRVSARPAGNMLEIVVADSGPGIPAEQHAAIFEAFVQADGSIRRQYAGAGLGLPISRQLVTLHQGEIWVESAPGQGARFRFTLPVTDRSPQPLQTRPTVSRPLPPARGTAPAQLPSPPPVVKGDQTFTFRILAVDDELINHQVLTNHLAGGRFELVHAYSGPEALKVLASAPSFHLVLLDIMMPQMSGFEVCQQIREKHLTSELPVIMLSAKNQVEDLVSGLAYGANDYIAKPFSKSELLARINTHLDLHHINTATARFVPTEFLRALGYQSITDLRLGDQVHQEVTVFFSDIRDYTQLSETMTPEENFGFVRAYARRMGPVIREYKGFVNQYLGDGIMALFPGDVAQAIQGSIVMQEVIRSYNQRRQQRQRDPIRVGMGLHTGPLIMGIIGDQSRTDAATISDTVNTAARMEGLTKYFGANLLVSEATRVRLQEPGRFNQRYLGQVQVKGRQNATGVYEFFDADPDYVQALKWATLTTFEQALTAYTNRDFRAAAAGFTEVLATNSEDIAASRYLSLCQQYQQAPPGLDWQGVIRLDSK